MDNGLMSQVDAARLLGLTRSRVSQLVSEGKLRHVTMWGRKLVFRADVEQRAAAK